MTSVVRRRLGFTAAVVGSMLMMAAASAPSPFYPDIQARLGVTAGGITAVFAIYAVALLAALLTTGRLSDHVGRRSVLSVGFALLAASVILFAVADSIETLLIARSLQGAASGVLLPALSATVTELERPTRPGSGAAWNSVAPLAGLAVGAIAGGAALSVLPDALIVLSGLFAIAFAAISAAVWIAPETSPRIHGWSRSLRPRLSVAPSVTRHFWVAVPALLAGWANGGLFLSLGASIVGTRFGVHAHLWQGASVGLIAATAAVAALVAPRVTTARSTTLLGTVGIAVGSGLSLVALATGALPLYLVAVGIAGAGFGATFTGVLRSLVPVVSPHERSGLFAAIYTVSYLSFGLPAVAAGLLVPSLTLGTTALWCAGTVVLLATAATVLRVRLSA